MPGFNIEVLGLTDVMRTFDALPEKIQRKALRPALRAGAKIFKESLIAAAPFDTGALAGSFSIRPFRSRKGRVGFRVDPGTKAELNIPKDTKSGAPRGYYPFAIEYGWRPGNRSLSKRVAVTRKDGSAVGTWKRLTDAEFGTRKVPANPFMHRAFSTAEAIVIEVVGEELAMRLGKLTTIRDDSGDVVDFSELDAVMA